MSLHDAVSESNHIKHLYSLCRAPVPGMHWKGEGSKWRVRSSWTELANGPEQLLSVANCQRRAVAEKEREQGRRLSPQRRGTCPYPLHPTLRKSSLNPYHPLESRHLQWHCAPGPSGLGWALWH